jgi:pyruvate-formate lyase-activating enzyme
MPIQIGGMVPLTTIDYPDHLSCVLFCQGCAWRCHYCHNPELIAPVGSTPVAWDEVLAFLHKRQGLLQAVVFSGGEATLQPGLPEAMQPGAQSWASRSACIRPASSPGCWKRSCRYVTGSVLMSRPRAVR